jgi:hypothetical protein
MPGALSTLSFFASSGSSASSRIVSVIFSLRDASSSSSLRVSSHVAHSRGGHEDLRGALREVVDLHAAFQPLA